MVEKYDPTEIPEEGFCNQAPWSGAIGLEHRCVQPAGHYPGSLHMNEDGTWAWGDLVVEAKLSAPDGTVVE